MRNEKLLFIMTLIVFGFIALTESILRKMMWPVLVIETLKVNTSFLKESQLDIPKYVLFQGTPI